MSGHKGKQGPLNLLSQIKAASESEKRSAMTHAFIGLRGEGHLPAGLGTQFQATRDLWLCGEVQADHRQADTGT